MKKGILKAVNLSKSYNGRVVLHNTSLSVSSGEVVGLLGPNGAGKTTGFYIIVGLVSCDSGSIKLDNLPIGSMPIYQRARLGISYLPQETSVFRKLTVEENIRAVLEVRIKRLGFTAPCDSIDRIQEKLLEELKINHIRHNSAISLSGGERRRVEIARALATNPRFILLDEPFAGVDPIAVIEIQHVICLLKKRGIGILITDHNVRETLGICDRAYIINAGEVLVSGHPDEVISNPIVRRIYLGENFHL